jgi:hypothetical protein
LHPDTNQQFDEAVWQAWLQKNKAQELIRYKRRLRVMALAAVFAMLIAVLWKFVV